MVRESMKFSYLIKIYTHTLMTKFVVDTKIEITELDQLHKVIIDYLGKNDIEWEPNLLKFTGSFYLTYEEVDDGRQQYGVVRKETEAREQMERDVS
jgi:hypothetical protein|tara:strand:- start:265 stop:552 length:288 start_codon:yes stop_codon:yes gene_type:complete